MEISKAICYSLTFQLLGDRPPTGTSPLDPTPRPLCSPKIALEYGLLVTDLLWTCCSETGVMDFGLKPIHAIAILSVVILDPAG